MEINTTISPCYPLAFTGHLPRRHRCQAPLALTLGITMMGTSYSVAAQEQPEPGSLAGAEDPIEVTLEHPSEHLLVSDFPGTSRDADLAVWQEYIPDIQDIEITSSADEASQPALYYDSDSDEEKPLLIVLHSWSTHYLQNIDIPLGEFAVANDWVFIHPDFRGENDGRPESTASDLVISDMQDALEYARDNANIDESRIYLLGYSGGAMNALHFASRHPEVFAGVAAWVPVYDLVTWYQWNAERGEEYAEEIASACGGEPTEGSEARKECIQRSVSAHLPDVAGEVRVLLAHGINDNTVPPEQALHAFNDLASEEDRISQDHIDQLEENREVPEELAERSTHGERDFKGFDDADAAVLLYLQSGPAELVLFDGEHEMLYRPGLEWLARQQR
ncbi:alpha/beta hydrolase family protein [Vreelandella zhanjiangensis]|uniref:alpha/beta hydrolase family protein n=1 Tax=Vreelandella zhanjiangensis TaxID=1121960 RepID=UPI00037C83E7|nr:alpha/beta fold hydrolase [Halomonas zhanjiangensis]